MRGSTAAAPGLRLHPRPSRGGCSLRWQGPPLALPVFQQLVQGCFHLLGCLCQTSRFPCCPWRSSVLCAAAARRDGCRKESSAAGLQAAHPRLGTPGLAATALSPQPRCFCQCLCIPGSIPAGPAPVLAGPPSGAARTPSWSRCSGGRIVLASWWFSLMLRLTDEASRRTWKQNFHSPWRSPAVTHAWGPGGFTRAQEEAEVSVEPL